MVLENLNSKPLYLCAINFILFEYGLYIFQIFFFINKLSKEVYIFS
jgi:hypothetical protein